MKHEISVKSTPSQRIAAVRARVSINGIAQAWKPALDQVWAFLRANSAFKPGHNLFLYHHPQNRNDAMDIDFGVQVALPFESQGNVQCVETPAGEVASTVHVGPYDRLREAHDAIHAWCRSNDRAIAHASWETYGDWHNDATKLETTVNYLLA